jgi:hypothetical protein
MSQSLATPRLTDLAIGRSVSPSRPTQFRRAITLSRLDTFDEKLRLANPGRSLSLLDKGLGQDMCSSEQLTGATR